MRVRLLPALLWCGILSSLLYVAINILVAMQWDGYSAASQVVSELSAVDAPTRALWNWLCLPYMPLVVAFGIGVRRAAGDNHRLRVAGVLVAVYGALGIGWPFFPMHLRETLAAGGGSLTDQMHIAFAMVTVLLMVLAMSFAAAALGARFRLYSIASLVVLLVFGTLTARDSQNLEQGLPTPLIGVWERLNIGVFLVWVVVLAVVLLRKQPPAFDTTTKPRDTPCQRA